MSLRLHLLVFFCTTLDILISPRNLNLTIIYEKLVIQSHIMLNRELFSLLSNANNPEMLEPKTYQQAINNQNPYYNDWKKYYKKKYNFW